MKSSGINHTIIAIVVIIISIGAAALLSGLTNEGSPILPPDKNSSQSESDQGKEIPDENDKRPSPKPTQGGIKGGNEAALKEGRLPGFKDKDINTDPDTFCYLLNSDVILSSPEAEGNIMVENDPGNVCPMQLCYYLEDTDELVYVSPMIAPDQHIEGDVLSKRLKKGEYKVNAVISVYDEESMELKTTFHEEVTLTVNQKFLGIF